MSTPMNDMQPPVKASILRVVKDQRKTEMVALALIVASFWIIGQLGNWTMAGCIARVCSSASSITWPPSTGCSR